MLLTSKNQIYISIWKAHQFLQVIWGRSTSMNIHRYSEGGGDRFYEFMKNDWV